MRAGIRPATAADLLVAASVVAGAFHPLAVARWLVPDEMQRLRMFPGYFAIFLEHAFEHGAVDLSPGREAVAAWLPHTGPSVPAPADYDRRLAEVAGGWLGRFTTFDALLEEHHPTWAHHYLALLAVRPDRQGRGLGSALLEHHHAELDRAGLPAYLEASSRSSRSLYLRHGYLPHGHPLVLPNGPLLWPLMRPPGNRTGPLRLLSAEPLPDRGGGHDRRDQDDPAARDHVHATHGAAPGGCRSGGRVAERVPPARR